MVNKCVIVADMQVSLANAKQLVRAIAPSGNLFLLLLLPELRRQGMTSLAFYVLQRIIDNPGIRGDTLRRETGLEDYEISRACKFLVGSGLIEMSRYEKDRRVRVLRSTRRGINIHGDVLLSAAKRLQKGLSAKEDGFEGAGEDRRMTEAAESFRQGNRILWGSM
jgi:DNA-binding MarR family transcriptional regulator